MTEPDEDDGDLPPNPEHLRLLEAWKRENCTTIARLIEVMTSLAQLHALELHSVTIDKRTADLRFSDVDPDPDEDDEHFNYPEARVTIRPDGLAEILFLSQAETEMVNDRIVEDTSKCTKVIVSPIAFAVLALLKGP